MENKNNIKLVPLEWNNSEHINNIFNNYPELDYIILSECLYEEAPFDKLLLTLIKFAKFYKKCKILFCYKKRYIFQDECIEKMKNYFNIENIDRNEIYQDYRDKYNYQFFKIYLK